MTTTTPRRSVHDRPGRPVTAAVLLALGTVYVVWGSTYLAIKVTVASLPPFLAMGTRFLLAGTVLCAGLLALRGPVAFRMTRQQLGTAALCGLLLLVGGNGLVAVAEQDVASGLTALLIAGTPLWVVVLRALSHDRPSAGTVAGLVLGLAGVVVLLLPGFRGATELLPLLLVLLSSLLWSLGTVLSTRRPLPADPFATTVVEMFAGGGAMLVLGAVGGEWGRLDVSAVSSSSWLSFGYLVGLGSVVAYSAYVWLLANAPLSLVTTYAYVNPAVAVLLGALLLDEPLTTSVLGGGVVIVAAVALVITTESRSRRPGDAAEEGSAPLEPA